MELPVAGYYRISKARDDMRAPDLYSEQIASYCSYRGLALAETYSDIDFSGYTNSRNRPGLGALIEARHRYASVVVPKLSRFGRSLAHLIELFETFETDGIALVFLDVGIDTQTSQGRLLRHIMAAFAEYESDVKSDYARATQRMLAREGRPHGPMAPYGYLVTGRRAERTYVVDAPAAAIVRSLFDGYLAGRSLNTLAIELNRRGVLGPKGGTWSRQRVKIILDNPAYAGFRIYDGQEFAGRWKPLVTRRQWDEVKARRHAARTTYNEPPGRASSLLSSLLVCGVCGHNLYHGKLNDRGSIYRCMTGDAIPPRCGGGQIAARRAESLVVAAVFEVLGLARDHALRQRAAEISRTYAASTILERRALLAEVAQRVTLVPRPPGNRHSKGMAIGRSLDVTWTKPWSLGSFGYVGATSLLTPRRPGVQSPVGKSWEQWRKLRILAPTFEATGGKRG